MLNYIWAGLIALSLVFALSSDVRDAAQDRYRNGAELPVTVRFKSATSVDNPVGVPVDVAIDPTTYKEFYRTEAAVAATYSGTLLGDGSRRVLRMGKGADLPAPLATMRSVGGSENELVADVVSLGTPDPATHAAPATVRFKPTRFVKLRAISQAATEFAEKAVTTALSLIGILCLWLGLMRIAEKSGLIDIVVRMIQPILHPLFPEIPKGHPAFGLIALNLSANMLGVGNAATPFGIKAMEELQKLNRSDDTATNPMVMLLALNTAGIQLMPPATLVAIMGLQTSRIYFPVLFVTFTCAIIAVVATKLLGRLPVFRRSDPDLLPERKPTE
jgi:spore maturation protein A